jgi:hypothetical protein
MIKAFPPRATLLLMHLPRKLILGMAMLLVIQCEESPNNQDHPAVASQEWCNANALENMFQKKATAHDPNKAQANATVHGSCGQKKLQMSKEMQYGWSVACTKQLWIMQRSKTTSMYIYVTTMLLFLHMLNE